VEARPGVGNAPLPGSWLCQHHPGSAIWLTVHRKSLRHRTGKPRRAAINLPATVGLCAGLPPQAAWTMIRRGQCTGWFAKPSI